jgi:hypothetical protein
LDQSAIDAVMAALQAGGGAPAPAQEVDPVLQETAYLHDPEQAVPFDPQRWSGVAEGAEELQMPGSQYAAPGTPERDAAELLAGPGTPSPGPGPGGRVSRSFSGVTEAGKRVSGSLFDQANRAAEADKAELFAQRDRDEADLERATLGRGVAIAEAGQAEQRHYERLAHLEDRIRDVNEGFAQLEQKIAANGKIHRERILGQYEEQLAGVRALSAVSANPLGGLSTTNKLGLGAAMFAQGFLAVQGIKIDVGSQIDTWVDRSLQEHQQKIQNARQDAQGTLHLYDIARQTSEDDWEARQRYRGFVMEGFKSSIQVEAARFGSDIAVSRARERLAELDMQLQLNKQVIGDRAEKAYLERNQLRAQEARDRSNAALQREQNSIGWGRIAEDRAARKAKDKTENGPQLIRDPGAIRRDKAGKVTGYGMGFVLKDPKKGLGTDAQKAYSGYFQIKPMLDKARALRKPAQNDFVEKYGQAAGVKRYSEAYRAWEVQKNLLGEQMIYALTGAAAPDAQMSRIRSGIADDSIWGSNSKSLDVTEAFFKDRALGSLRGDTNVRQLTSEERKALDAEGGYYDEVSDESESQALYDAQLGGGEPVVKAASKAAEPAFGTHSRQVGKPDKLHSEGGYSPSFVAYAERTNAPVSISSNRDHVRGQSRGIDAIDHLATLVVRPAEGVTGTVDGVSSDDLQQVQRDAMTMIDNIAADDTRPEVVRGYARDVAEQLRNPWSETSPDAMYSHFGARVHGDVLEDNPIDRPPADRPREPEARGRNQ